MDITNYMSEKGIEDPKEIASTILQHIQIEFKVECFIGLAQNSLLSLLSTAIS